MSIMWESVEIIFESDDIKSIHKTCQDFEIEIEAANHIDIDIDIKKMFYLKYFIVTLISSDLYISRLLWYRIPEDFKKDVIFISLWNILKSLWNHDSHTALTTLVQCKSSPNIVPLIQRLEDTIQKNQLKRISNLYTNYNIDKLSYELNTSLVECINYCKKYGYTYDNSTKLIYFHTADIKQNLHIYNKVTDTLSEKENYMYELSQITANLERKNIRIDKQILKTLSATTTTTTTTSTTSGTTTNATTGTTSSNMNTAGLRSESTMIVNEEMKI